MRLNGKEQLAVVAVGLGLGHGGAEGGLIHHWPFDGDTVDEVTAIAAPVTGTAAYCAGPRDQAFCFDGSTYIDTQYVALLASGEPISVAFWAEIPDGGTTTTGEYIFGFQATGSSQLSATLQGEQGPFWAFLRDDDWVNNTIPNTDVLDGNWHHFAIVRDDSDGTFKLYIDGALDQSLPDITNVINNTYQLPMYIGADNHNSGGAHNPFYGPVDDFRIYDHALTLPEVEALYQLGTMTNYWPFNCSDNDQVTHTVPDIVGAVRTDGVAKIGEAYATDGATTYVDTNIIPQYGTGQSLTWSMMAKLPLGNPAAQMDIAGFETTVGGEIRLTLLTDGTVRWRVRDDNNGGNVAAFSHPMADGRWHHFAGLRDASTLKLYLYIDGWLVDEDSEPNGPVNVGPQRELFLGCDNHSGGLRYFFDGIVDEVRLFDYALSTEEIREYVPGFNPCPWDLVYPRGVEQQDLNAVLNHWGDPDCEPPSSRDAYRGWAIGKK